jgi:hypothetical protein
MLYKRRMSIKDYCGAHAMEVYTLSKNVTNVIRTYTIYRTLCCILAHKIVRTGELQSDNDE